MIRGDAFGAGIEVAGPAAVLHLSFSDVLPADVALEIRMRSLVALQEMTLGTLQHRFLYLPGRPDLS